ncbi:MAG: hypothetical protein KF820_07870 [Candidatus Paracaedibacteraceae bacterium]|nr:hypothetical protein [Candidatus Paracaedibacteraceae bacterium]
MKFIFNSYLLTEILFAAQQPTIPYKNDLSMVISSEGDFEGYNIDQQINRILQLFPPRGLIIGRGNAQGMADPSEPFNNVRYNWSYLDPYAIAHNLQNPDPYLIMDFAARSPVALKIFNQLESCFDLIVIDRKTVQFFAHINEIIYQCLGLLSPNGQLVVPIEDNMSADVLTNPEFSSLINVEYLETIWPFKGQNAPRNYGLDMSNIQKSVGYAIISFKSLKPSRIIEKKLNEIFRTNKGYIPKLLKIFFMVNNGTLSEPNLSHSHEFFGSMAQIYSANNVDELQDVIQIQVRNQENLSDLELGFMNLIIGEKLRSFGELNAAKDYYTRAAEKKQTWSVYRLKNDPNVDSSLDTLFGILSSERLSVIVNDNLMDSDHSLKDILVKYAFPGIAPLQRSIPAVASMTISILQSKLPEFRSQSISTLGNATNHINKLLQMDKTEN